MHADGRNDAPTIPATIGEVLSVITPKLHGNAIDRSKTGAARLLPCGRARRFSISDGGRQPVQIPPRAVRFQASHARNNSAEKSRARPADCARPVPEYDLANGRRASRTMRRTISP